MKIKMKSEIKKLSPLCMNLTQYVKHMLYNIILPEPSMSFYVSCDL